MESLCQNYHWTHKQAMSLTLPQIFMWSHAAHINSKRTDARVEKDRIAKEKEEKNKKLRDEKDPIIPVLGKRMSECNSEEIASQFSQW